MTKTRLEAFSDGVMAIIITIMVLELRAPAETDWTALRHLSSEFSAYVLSFIILGIYWNNHHYMIHAASRVSAAVLWANLHLLFWLSLFPFVTAWMGRNHLAPVPAAAYGGAMFMAGCSYWILQQTVIAVDGPESRIARSIGSDRKGVISVALYALAIAFAFVNPWISDAIYVFVALMWLVPDPRLKPT